MKNSIVLYAVLSSIFLCSCTQEEPSTLPVSLNKPETLCLDSLPMSKLDGTVRLREVEVRHMPDFPECPMRSLYNHKQCKFSEDGLLHILRGIDGRTEDNSDDDEYYTLNQGELCMIDPRLNAIRKTPIPQPTNTANPKPPKSFDPPTNLLISPKNNMLMWWSIVGNGDHAIALQDDKGGLTSWRTPSSKYFMNFSVACLSENGTWYMIVYSASMAQEFHITVYRVDKDASITPIGNYSGTGQQPHKNLDVISISPERLRFLWVDVQSTDNNRIRIWTFDFDLNKKTWSEPKLLGWTDSMCFTTSCQIFKLSNSNYAYLWHAEPFGGFFYLEEGMKQPLRLPFCENEFQAFQHGDRVVVAYSLDDEPCKLNLCVINNRKVGAATSIDLGKRDFAIHERNIILGKAGPDQLWFVDTEKKNFHLLEFVE